MGKRITYVILKYLSAVSAKDCVNVALTCKRLCKDENVKENLILWKSYTLVKRIISDIDYFGFPTLVGKQALYECTKSNLGDTKYGIN